MQQLLEETLFKVVGVDRPIIGCGRTDAGVHASQYYFHVDYKDETPSDFKFILNKNLPSDITVFDIIQYNQNYHAQFDATTRTYVYLLHDNYNPFLENLSCCLDKPISDHNAMVKATQLIKEHSDFRSFCKTPDKHDSTQCRISDCTWKADLDNGHYQMTISANRFLRGMIRSLMHDLILLGHGNMNLKEFHKKLTDPQNAQGIKLAPPEGLYLNKIKYPFLELPNAATLPFQLN